MAGPGLGEPLRMFRASPLLALAAILSSLGATSCKSSGCRVSPSAAGAIPGEARAVGVALGSEHACALMSTGRVVCWGGNSRGQLGDATRRDRLSPAAICGIEDAVQITVGAMHSCARQRSGVVLCWGDGAAGQLGDGGTEYRKQPVGVHSPDVGGAPLADTVDISAGGSHTCAVRAEGSVVCWGRNTAGQLGDPRWPDAKAVPLATVVPGISDAVGVFAGARSTCVRHRDGGLSCWGWNREGELGFLRTGEIARAAECGSELGELEDRPVRVPVLRDAVQGSLGTSHGCAVFGGGKVSCWGEASLGRLGTPARSVTPAPSLTVAPSGPICAGARDLGVLAFAEVAAGARHTCARLANGQVACWGSNEHGALGGASKRKAIDTPELVPGIVDATSIASGRDRSCATLRTGRVVCWGASEVETGPQEIGGI